jgi:hypothetical protein
MTLNITILTPARDILICPEPGYMVAITLDNDNGLRLSEAWSWEWAVTEPAARNPHPEGGCPGKA